MKSTIVQRIETYIQDYATLGEPFYVLPLALWIIGTYCFNEFDAYPYLVITSATKRSGKTRLAEMISFCCANPRNFAALTPAALFRSIEKEKPTLIHDEAEELSRESAGTMRSVLNVGYRRGQTIPRVTTDGEIQEFQTYCPKAFVLIGDVFDTLKDRSMIVTMRRAETRKRFTFEAVQAEGRLIREQIGAEVTEQTGAIQHAFLNHGGLPFLQDRDEEIWTSLFCLCSIFAKSRLTELTAAAADMAAEKTGESRKYITLEKSEDEAVNDEYGKRALTDLYGLFVVSGRVIRTEDAIEGLKAIPSAPWRRFRGKGITDRELAKLLDRFGLEPVRIAVGSGRGKQKFYRGYKRKDVETALNKL